VLPETAGKNFNDTRVPDPFEICFNALFQSDKTGGGNVPPPLM
jgi:hypothetical protein